MSNDIEASAADSFATNVSDGLDTSSVGTRSGLAFQPRFSTSKFRLEGPLTAERWIKRFASEATAMRIPEEDWPRLASLHLVDELDYWVETLSDSTLNNWEEFSKLFTLWFRQL